MAELEIHHESEHAIDPMGQKVGLLAAILAVCLAIVTIASHRTHTEAIIDKSEANDAWQHYQAGRIKYHNLELGESLTAIVSGKSPEAAKALEDFRAQKVKYEKQGEEIQEEARHKQQQSEAAEHRALRYDFGEGLLEIALVLSSLYFISRKRLFPTIGVVAGIAGLLIAVTGLVV